MTRHDRVPGRRWLTPVSVALVVWCILGALLIAFNWPRIVTLDLPDTDDAMRMVQVRDLMAGQSWWNLMQYRLNPAGGGVLMHWSRFVDAPIVAGIWLLKPFFGQSMAETIVLVLWPPIMGAILSVVCALGYRNLPDRRFAYLIPFFLVNLGFVVAQFRPLHVDHHGWQILLAMVMMWQAIRPPSWQAGVLAGLAAAMLLAISIEGLPITAVFAGLAGVRWALHGAPEDRQRLCGYMASLGIFAAFFQFLTRGPDGLVGMWCDSLSAPYIDALLVAGAATVAATYVRATRLVRFALLGAAAVLAALVLLWVEPQCAKGPFAALDPIVVRLWYSIILEGQPLWAWPAHDILYVLVPSLLGFLGTLGGWRESRTADDRRRWTTIFVALTGATLLSIVVMRSVSTAHIFALPGCVWLSVRAWTAARSMRSAGLRILATASTVASLPLLASVIVVSALSWVIPSIKTEPTEEAAGQEPHCLTPRTVAILNRFKPETVLAPLDLGPQILFWTHHNVVATGHHRNAEAMADTLWAFTSEPSKAEAYVRKTKTSLVIFCDAVDFETYRKDNPKGLAAMLKRGQAPEWLEPLAFGRAEGLSVWRVKPATR